MKKYSFTIGICFLVLWGFAQKDNWSRPTYKKTEKQMLQDTSINKLEKINDTDNRSYFQNDLLYDNSGNPIRPDHIIKKENQSVSPGVVDSQSAKTNVSDSVKQNNKPIDKAPIRETFKPH